MKNLISNISRRMDNLDRKRNSDLELLSNSMKDADCETKINICKEMARQPFGDRKAIFTLVFLLKDKEYQVRIAALLALEKVSLPNSSESLVASIKDFHPDMEEAASTHKIHVGPRQLKRAALYIAVTILTLTLLYLILGWNPILVCWITGCILLSLKIFQWILFTEYHCPNCQSKVSLRYKRCWYCGARIESKVRIEKPFLIVGTILVGLLAWVIFPRFPYLPAFPGMTPPNPYGSLDDPIYLFAGAGIGYLCSYIAKKIEID
jgi:DNA-directed RNA polymerase subunit RPC12/RpoP